MKIACISDTHCQLRKIKEKVTKIEADLLIHAGDLTYRGTVPEIAAELYDLGQMGKNFKYGVIAICGNHDWLGEKDPNLMMEIAKENRVIWLQDRSTTIEGIHFYGTAYTPEFCEWAFNLDRYDGSLEEAWSRIPEGVDVLITHGPALFALDHHYNGNLGCRFLKDAIERVKPQAHVFGHIHHAYGTKVGADGIIYVNAATCNEEYRPINEPIVFEIERKS